MIADWSLAQRILDRTSDAVLAIDGGLRIVYLNAAMETMSGLRGADVAGQPVMDVFPFLVEAGQEPLIRAALAGAETASPARAFVTPDRRRRGFFEAHYAPLRDGEAVVGVVAVLNDISARQQADEQLRETESRFRNMADASPVLLWMAGTDGLCTFFNQTWLRFTGRTFEQEWGVGWAEGVHFEDFQRCMDTYLHSFNQRQSFQMEYRLRRADGEYRWVLDHGRPRYTPDGAFAGYIGSCVDITDRRQMEVELRRALRVRDEFLASASHELKTPLTSLQLQADLLLRQIRRGLQDPARAADAGSTVEAIRRQVAHFTKLIDALLDVSRITAGRVDLEYAEHDLSETLRQLVARWQPTASSAGCELALSADGPCTGSWDLLRIEQVLDNLLSNALKYGPGRPIELRLSCDAARATISVADHGQGIPERDHGRIFERFERMGSVRRYGGLGLGLWIARQLVERMKGTIRVISAPGQGATFLVELPRRAGAAPVGQEPAERSQPRPIEIDASNTRAE